MYFRNGLRRQHWVKVQLKMSCGIKKSLSFAPPKKSQLKYCVCLLLHVDLTYRVTGKFCAAYTCALFSVCKIYRDDASPWHVQLQTGRRWAAACQEQAPAWSGHHCRDVPASFPPADLVSADVVHDVTRRFLIWGKILSW